MRSGRGSNQCIHKLVSYPGSWWAGNPPRAWVDQDPGYEANVVSIQYLRGWACPPGRIFMAYGSTPYVGMTPKKNGGLIKSAQMTRSKCLHRLVNCLHEPYQALSSTSMGNRTVNLLESIAKVPDRQSLKRAESSIF